MPTLKFWPPDHPKAHRQDRYRHPPKHASLPDGDPVKALAATGHYFAPTLQALPVDWRQRLHIACWHGDSKAIIDAHRLPGECADTWSVYYIEFDCGAQYVGYTELHVLTRVDEHMGRYKKRECGSYQARGIGAELAAGCKPIKVAIIASGLDEATAKHIEIEWILQLDKPLNLEHARRKYTPCSQPPQPPHWTAEELLARDLKQRLGPADPRDTDLPEPRDWDAYGNSPRTQTTNGARE